MRRAFSVGQIVFLAIVILVFVNVILPKIKSVKDGALGMAYVSELEAALKSIDDYHFMRGDFGVLRDMTMVRNFDDSALNSKLEVDKPIQYGVGVKGKSGFEYCAELRLKKNGNDYSIEISDLNHKKEVCKEFQSNPTYAKLRNFPIRK